MNIQFLELYSTYKANCRTQIRKKPFRSAINCSDIPDIKSLTWYAMISWSLSSKVVSLNDALEVEGGFTNEQNLVI